MPYNIYNKKMLSTGGSSALSPASNYPDKIIPTGVNPSFHSAKMLPIIGGSGAQYFYEGVGSDDGYSPTAVGSFNNSGNDVIIGWTGTEYLCYGFFRFPNITIAKGSIIKDAYLTLYCNYVSATGNSWLRGANDADDAIAPTTKGEYSALVKTYNTDPFTPPTGTGSFNVTSLASVIQTVIDRPGWSYGNALMILLENILFQNGKYHKINSFEAGSNPATLYIDWGYGPDLISETFEDATNYDLGRWGDPGSGFWYVDEDTGCTVDPNYATSNIGSPSGWGSECLRCIMGTAGSENDANIRPSTNIGPPYGETYTEMYLTFEFLIPSTQSLGDYQGEYILQLHNDIVIPITDIATITIAYLSGTGFYFIASVQDPGGGGDGGGYSQEYPLSQDTAYKVYVKFSRADEEVAVYFNSLSTEVCSVALTGSGLTCEVAIVNFGLDKFGSLDNELEVCFDNLFVDDSAFL